MIRYRYYLLEYCIVGEWYYAKVRARGKEMACFLLGKHLFNRAVTCIRVSKYDQEHLKKIVISL